MKSKQLILVLGLIAGLTACHENPLNTHKTQQNVAFLRQAAISAEHAMKLSAHKGGRFYSNCMEDNKEAIDCDTFFKQMLQFAQTNKEYHNLTYVELTNARMYSFLAEDYQSKIFNTIDD
jgi:hypothetical protein